MARVLYRPEPGTGDLPHQQFGISWGSDPVEVTDPKVLAKVRDNPFYEVLDDAAGLTAVHRGRGVYGVLDDGEPHPDAPSMTKEDADAFNAMSDEDKAAFLAKTAE